MPRFELRKYQQKCVEAFDDWYPSDPIGQDVNDRLSTIILPTGTGKTASAVASIENWSNKNNKIPKVLWAAHREELIDQAADEFRQSIPGANVQIEMSDNRATPDADIVVGSVQTLHRNRKNIKEFEPEIVTIDEWHHYHEKNTQYHGLLEKYPKAKVLGLTATPFRFIGGDLPLGKKLIEMDIGTAIAHKYLVPPKPEVLKSNVSLASVKSRGGDFAIEQLASVVNTDERNWMIAKRVLSAINDEKRRGILFGVNVDHSKRMAELLRKGGVRVGEVYGETPKDERRELIQRIKNGEIDVLCNNLALTEGFDVPHLDFVCIARPTKSLGLFIQMLGRGLRLFEGKKDCLVIDVFDKVKATQGIATYQKVAALGDIDGSRRRFDAIMKEELAEKLSNFPVVMRLGRDEIWRLDTKSWFTPSWELDANQWVITWSKKTERVLKDTTSWAPIKYTPKKTSLAHKPLNVKHPKFGEGIAKDINYGSEDHYVVVDFKEEGVQTVSLSALMVQEQEYEIKQLDKAIKRAFYIISNDNKTYCRVIGLAKDGSKFSVVTDIKGDKTTVDEVVRAFANEDDMIPILKASAPWRKRPASSKQKDFINRLITWGKLNSDIDMDSLTGGDASALMDQADWKPIINNMFGAKKREDLIGYLKEFDDV